MRVNISSIMSDTDDDLVPNSFHKFPHENTVIHTQLLKSSNGSYTNMMTSNFNMPHRFMGFDQRSVYSRRETSPMSLRSFSNSRMPYQQPYPQSAMSSRGSVINARCRSPMSVRSNYSNTTVSAADIALALKNYKFNKNDERMIHDAYTAFKKSRMRKRIGKRRNLKSFLKYCRRNSGGESGAEGSNSSVSSDDCRSTRSAFYTRNIPKVRARSPRIDLNKFTSQVRENDNYTDCTENIKQNSFRNLITTQSRIVNHNFLPHCKQQNVPYNNRFPDIPETHKDLCSKRQNAPVTLKYRLAKDTSLLLPIQRFNMSNANPTYEISYKVKSKAVRQKEFSSNNQFEESDNESEEIFGPSTSRVNQTLSKTLQQKRVLETESVSYPESKRQKLTTSPVKQNKSLSSKNMKKITTNTKDFNFKKPLLPVRKFGTLVRDNEPEVLIAKSSQPLDGNVESLSNPLKEMPQVVFTSKEKSDTNKQTNQALQNHIDSMNNNTVADETHNSTVCSKPSFTKRKLFTQKLDIVENKNISSDSSGVNSPQTKALRASRKKKKVRKLTSQSCLNRDISDNNYMDLLHKLLPPDQIKNQTLNNTNVTNKMEANKHGNQYKNHTLNNANVANKETSKHGDQIKGKTVKNTNVANKKEASKQSPVRDVIIDISRCDNDAGSETYTDEEIFNVTQEDKGKTNAEQSEKQYPITQHKTTAKSFVKTFWDTDIESDMEDRVTLTSQKNLEKDQIPRNTHFLMNGTNGVGAKNRPRGTILSLRNLCKPPVNQSTRSNDTQTLKGKMLDNHKQQENNDTQKLKGKMLVNNKQQENKENVTDYNMLNKSTCSKHKANLHTDTITSNTNDTDKVSNNLNYKSKDQKSNKVQKPKLRTPSSKNNNKQSESIFNISRESLRNKQNKNANLNNTYTKDVQSSEIESLKCNTSRESMRLKQKRKACLNNSSTDNIKSSENQFTKCNTSRESIRLKQKREAKLNGNVTKNKRDCIPGKDVGYFISLQQTFKVKSKAVRQKEFSSNNQFEESDNESEEIFGPSTSRVNQTLSKTLQQKRVLETESVSYPESKRQKLTTSPVKQNKSLSSKNMKKITTNTKDFNFKKPLLPVRKFGTLVRDNEPEVLIAKSSQPLDGNVESLSNPLKEMPQVVFTSKEKSDTNKQTNQALQNHIDSMNNNTVADETHNSTVCSKPSFTKRKLFTQKLDIVENKNISSDSSGVNSPQTKALRASRKKKKVRKLTSQSCLNRDISDNNYMDLLHKLLPPDQIKNQTLNNTNVTNKMEANKHGNQYKNHTLNNANVANKETSKHGDQIKGKTVKNTNVANKKEASKQSPVRDVIIDISRCDNDAGSETYTDEEIFNVTQEDKGKTNAEQSEKQYPITQHKTTAKSFVKTFWDTDIESDMEDRVTLTSQKNLEKDQIPRNTHFLMNGTNGVGAKNRPRGTILSLRNLCKPPVNQSTRSNDTQTLKGKMLDNHKQQENNDTQKLKGKMLVNNKQQENKENVTDYNMLNKSTCSKHKANLHTDTITSNTNDTDKVSNNLNYKSKDQKSNKVQKPKLRTPSSKNNNKQSESIFNISRESLRNKQNKNANLNNTYTKDVQSSEIESLKCNTSRESMRLKQKRKACLNNSSTDNIKSSENQFTKCNTSRESIRLKQKREAKLNGNVTKNKR